MVSLGPACLSGGGSNKPPATLPSAPTNLVADPSPTTARIDLSWIDTANNEFEFRIERSDDGGITWAQVGTVPKNTQGYTDLGLLAGTTYFYRVAAWNGKGYSPFAGPVSSKTKALTWTLVPAGAADPTVGRSNHTAIYDAIGSRMIVFGGFDDVFNVLNEVWSFDLGPSGPGPWKLEPIGGVVASPFRVGHSAVYDSILRRMIVFGGQDENLVPSNLVYVLDLGQNPLVWSQAAVTGTPPDARAFHTAVYDSVNQRMIVYGGENGGPFPLDDVSYLTFPTSTSFDWSNPSIGARPVHRSQHVAVYDPMGSRMVVFGGLDQDAALDGSSLNNETWTFTQNPANWTNLQFPGTPGYRMGHTAVYDAANRRLVTYSGANSSTPTLTDEMWGLRLDVSPIWSIMNPSAGSPPPGRSGHSAIYDGGSKRMIIYGGVDDTLTPFNEVWIVEL